MAKAIPNSLQPQVPEIDPVVAPVAADGPEIVYLGEGAELVKFTINPKAGRYVVNANGMILEYLK